MKKLLILITILTLFGSPAFADEATWLVENEGGFTYRLPDGWVLKPIPGLKYRFAFGPSGPIFTPNINVVDEPFDGKLPAYVDANLVAMKKLFQDFVLISREPFKTGDGLQGIRLVITNRQNNTDLRQTFYFFQAEAGRFLVVTCTDLASNKDSLDSTFLESMKTFKVL